MCACPSQDPPEAGSFRVTVLPLSLAHVQVKLFLYLLEQIVSRGLVNPTQQYPKLYVGPMLSRTSFASMYKNVLSAADRLQARFACCC